MTIDPRLAEILACPACRAALDAGDTRLTCTGCGLVYPVVDGIPVLLVDEATGPA